MYDENFIILPKQGRLIVVTDIHGNKEDFDRYVDDIWDQNDPNCHILFLGDLIHELKYSEDLSLDILDRCNTLLECPNFHVLLGNHELCQVTDESVWKWGTNQTKDFKEHIKDRISDKVEYDVFLTIYLDIISHFSHFCKTQNGIFFSHAGISDNALAYLDENNINIANLNLNNIVDYKFFEKMVWSRPYDDYIEDEIDSFLKIVDCKFMCVGHTPMDGLHILGNQLIFDSSYCTTKKYYLDIDLSKDYDNIIDILKCTKELE